jgi:hypothetical protein
MEYRNGYLVYDSNDENDMALMKRRKQYEDFILREAPHYPWLLEGPLEILSAAISETCPTQVSYSPFENELLVRRRISWGKWLKKAARLSGVQIVDSEVHRIADAAVHLFEQQDWRATALPISEIYEVYQNTYETCMTGKDDLLDFYTKTPERFGLVVSYHRGDLIGRAITFKTDQGPVVVGRIYPDHNGGHRSAIIRLAKERGWDYPVKTGRDSPFESGRTYTVTVRAAKRYPYIDIFQVGRCLSQEELQLTNDPSLFKGKQDVYMFVRTDGGNDRAVYTYRGTVLPKSHARLLTIGRHAGEWAGADEACYALSENGYGYALGDEVVMGRDDTLLRSDAVQPYRCRERYLRSETVVDYAGRPIRLLDAIKLEAGPHAGEYAHIDEAQKDENNKIVLSERSSYEVSNL